MRVSKIIEILAWGAILAAFLLILIMNVYSAKPHEVIEKERLEKAIISEVSRKYPNADVIEVINLISLGNTKEAVVRVSFNLSSSCPQRIHLHFYYPKQHFLPKLPEHIVEGCNFCKKGNCIIWFEEEAIQASVNMPGLEKVRAFVEKYHAKPYINKDKDTWHVLWSSEDKYCSVVLQQTGEIMSVDCNM